MIYLFILESIGTPELLMIGLVALVIFGPRKLPELARTLGKAMNEFRRSTDEFKQTWEREVDFELKRDVVSADEPIQRSELSAENKIITPEIKEINQAEFHEKTLKQEEATISKPAEIKITDKRDWL